MTDILKCISEAAAGGFISPEAKQEYLARLQELADDFAERSGKSFEESAQDSAVRLQDEIERSIRRRKRMQLFQAKRQDEIRARLAASGDEAKAALSVLGFDPRLEHVGPNVEMRHQGLRGSAFARMNEFVDKFRSKIGGLRRETAGLDDVVAELFGEATGNAEAKALAGGIEEARAFLVGRHNSSGGDIVQRKGWGWAQKHDRVAIARVDREVWEDFTIARLDPLRMLNDDGAPMTARQLRSAVKGAYESILSGGLDEISAPPRFGSPVNRRIHARELVFRNSQTWLEYKREFGDQDIFGSIVGEIDRLARDVSVIEVLGPYPHASMETMKNIIDGARGRAATEGTGRAAHKAAESIGKHRNLESVFDQVVGSANIPADSGLARASQSNRNLVTAARLGSAIFVSVSDAATMALTANMNGLPISRVMRRFVGQLNPASAADRRLAARAGYIAETWIGHQVAAQRLIGEISGAPSTAKIADTVLRMSGLSAWTDGGRAAFRLEFVGFLTDNANRAWDDVPGALRGAMARHGIDAGDWERYRSTPLWVDAETGADFIRPEDVYEEFARMALPEGEKAARLDTARKFENMIHTEGYFAVVSPTARARAIATGGTQPGSAWGEIIRNATLFRSFAISFMYLHGSRAITQPGAMSKAKYMASVFAGMTAAGAFAEQMSSIARGKDPLPMDDPKFWGSAVIRGGSLGPIGDFLFSSVSRHGNSLPEALLGPVLGGQLIAGAKLTAGNIRELIEKGETKNLAPELQRFADGLLPGQSLWYARLALERLVKDELQKMADPKAHRRFARMQARARKEFKQGFWWKPGRAAPERLPELGKAVDSS